MRADRDKISNWIDLVHGRSEGPINVCVEGNWGGVIRTEIEDAVDAAMTYDSTGLAKGIYLRTTTLTSTLPAREGRRGRDDESMSCPGFAADIDMASPAREEVNARSGLPYPPDVATVMSIVVESGLPEPTLWVHSGWGMYPWWLLAEPFAVDTDESRARFKVISDQIQKNLHYTAANLGWDFQLGVGDLSRVLRIPGTVNRKVADQPKMCHVLSENGAPYDLDELEDLVAQAWEACPKPAAPEPRPISVPRPTGDAGGLKPGEDFNERGSWLDILPSHGWTLVKQERSGTVYWRRPGKDEGISATTGHSHGGDRLFVFSTSTVFDSMTPINKHHALAVLEFNGDHSAASSYLRKQGFGGDLPKLHKATDAVSLVRPTPQVPAAVKAVDEQKPLETAVVVQANETLPVLGHDGLPVFTNDVYTSQRWNEMGLASMYSSTFCKGLRFLHAVDEWRIWDGQRWTRDDMGRYALASRKLLTGLLDYAHAQEAAGNEHGAAMVKKAERLATLSRVGSLVSVAKRDECLTASPSDFNRHKHLVTVDNGVLNLLTGELTDFDPDLMLTKKINARRDPDAQGPRTTKFLESVQPDPAMRTYMKRLAGYTLLGNADERVLPIVWGKSGSGKSAFLEMLYHVLGDFASIADPSTLMPAPDNYQGPSEKLHSLMHARFVKMSELPENATLNQALVKNITGSDTQKTRPLYGPLVEWQVEYTVWMATNNLPKVTSTDDAIWKRLKPIHFPNVFVNEDGSVKNAADKDLGRQLARDEASFILNWLLEGVQEYLKHGLEEPVAIGDGVTEYRDEMDTVRQFVAEAQENGQIKLEDGLSIAARDLYKIYLAWASDAQIKFPLSEPGFKKRMEASGHERHRVASGMVYKNIGAAGWIAQAQTPSSGNQWMGRQRN